MPEDISMILLSFHLAVVNITIYCVNKRVSMGLTINRQTIKKVTVNCQNHQLNQALLVVKCLLLRTFLTSNIMVLNPGSIYIFQNKLMYKNFSFDSPSF